MIFLIIGYVVGVSVLPTAPNSSLVKVMSLIPMFSPTLMPMRIALNSMPKHLDDTSVRATYGGFR